jgi:hypothetical protein
MVIFCSKNSNYYPFIQPLIKNIAVKTALRNAFFKQLIVQIRSCKKRIQFI